MFSKKRTLSLVVSAALAASMMLTACTQTTPPATDGTNGDATAPNAATAAKYPGTSEPGTVVINNTQEPPELFSVPSSDTASANILRHCVDGLVVLDPKDEPVAGVAKDWTISDDGLVYTFNLRNDYKWSNGEPVTAKDFQFAMKSLLDPEFAAPYSYFGYTLKNGQKFAEGKGSFEDVGVKVIDDYKLELTLENPTPYFLGMLAHTVFLPLNQKGYEAAAGKYGTDADKIVTNGAYNLTSWEHENELVLEKNPNYPGAANIQINKIIIKMIKDTNTAINSFKSNEIDMIAVNGDNAAAFTAEGQPVQSFEDASNWYFEFNTADPILKNAKIRQAITIAVDSESYVKNVLKDKSKPATQFTPSAIKGNKKAFAEEVGPQFKAHDIEKAKQLVEEGKKELGIDDIEINFLIDDVTSASRDAAFFQENWQRELGIKVNVTAVPFKQRLEKMTNKDFQIVMAGWGPDYNDPMTFLEMFQTGNGNNHTSYSNPKYDELCKKVVTEVDRDKRFGYLMEMEQILMTDMPIGPYFFRSVSYVTSGKVEGIVRTGFQDWNLKYAKTTR